MNSSSQPCEHSPVLQLNEVAVGYGRWPVLNSVSFEVREREVLGLTGDNAVGKTSIFRALFAEGAWLRGHVAWCGEAVPHLRTTTTSGVAAWVRQDRPIFPTFTVEDALQAVVSGRTRRERRQQVDHLLERMPELRPLLNRPMERLSGGERALTSVGVGLVNEPRLLCLDEPAANLSAETQERLREIISKYAADTGAACVVVEHRTGLFVKLATKLVELRRPEELAQ